MADVVELSGIVLPEHLGLRREHVVAARHRPEDYDDRYDFRTLIYDAVHLPDRRAVWLVCPKLRNLGAVQRAADLRLDGRKVAVRRIRRFDRYDIAELPAPDAAAALALGIGDWQAEAPVHGRDAETFAGRNTLVTLSRNNALEWIADWARFHVREQGADAVLFFDNGSTAYSAGDVAETLRGVEGLAAVKVVAADFPFGPVGRKPRRFDANFLQAAMLNLARIRFLAPARAALVCDVDELVFRRTDVPIFDATAASRSGYLRFRGSWRYPDTAPDVTPRHRDHVLAGGAERPSPPKYCVVPGGRLRAKSWSVHRVQGVLLQSRHESADFGFLHCHGISDFWKGRPSPKGAGTPDQEASAVLARGFG